MADRKMGLLVAGFDYSGANEDEFNDWYDTEHVPERRAVPGFINCERWIGAENPKISVATYDLDSFDVLQSEAYRKIAGANLSPWSKRVTAKCKRICRFEAEQMPPGNQRAPASAPGLLIVAMNASPEAEKDFNDWYDQEHIPALSKVEGCLSAPLQDREQRQRRHATLSRRLSPWLAGGLLVGCLEKGGRDAMDRARATSLPRSAEDRAQTLRAQGLRCHV